MIISKVEKLIRNLLFMQFQIQLHKWRRAKYILRAKSLRVLRSCVTNVQFNYSLSSPKKLSFDMLIKTGVVPVGKFLSKYEKIPVHGAFMKSKVQRAVDVINGNSLPLWMECLHVKPFLLYVF